MSVQTYQERDIPAVMVDVMRTICLSDWNMYCCRQVVVEDVAMEQGEDLSFVRRMVFISNSNLVQSEAVLRPDPEGLPLLWPIYRCSVSKFLTTTILSPSQGLAGE